MTGPTLQVLVEGDVPVKLARLANVLQPVRMGIFLGDVVDPQLRRRADARFQSEGDDASGRWASLTEATQSIRAQLGFGAAHPINVRTGELAAFIQDAPNAIEVDAEGATMTLPDNVPGGELGKKFMGAQQGEGRAPARPVLALSRVDAMQAMTALEYYIRTGVA